MKQTCAELSTTEHVEAPVTAVQSAETVAVGGTAAPGSTRCNAAPSGASWTAVPRSGQAAAAEAGSELDDGPHPGAGAAAVSWKETWCAVENMPRESWLRRRRKHWPDQSRSTVFAFLCDKVETPARCDWLGPAPPDERRHHFPGRSNSQIPLR